MVLILHASQSVKKYFMSCHASKSLVLILGSWRTDLALFYPDFSYSQRYHQVRNFDKYHDNGAFSDIIASSSSHQP